MIKQFHKPQKQRGIALIASLIILLLMTIVGLSIMRGNSFFEKTAGNTRDKQRALQAAQNALLYGEWWLNNGGSITNVACSTTATPTAMQVCTYDPGPSTANLASNVQWFPYLPTNMKIQSSGSSTAGGLVDSTSATSDVIYSQSPGVYINCISPCGTPLGSGQSLFRITAIGYGGIGGVNGTVAIVQSVYAAGGGPPLSHPLDGA